MNKLAYIIPIIFCLACNSSKEKAIIYNDNFVQQELLVINKEDSLIDAISRNQPEIAKVVYQNFLSQIKSSTKIVNNTASFEGEIEFKKAILNLLKTYQSVAENEYFDMIKISEIPDERYSKVDDEKLIALTKKIDAELNEEMNIFANAQKKFADKYHFELTRAKINKN